ncbi:MAG TPA: DUF342 domain-containing protein [Firmicutes bacterium]|nr:DUF342 domain-containing protein [Bacillota bacterium]
MGETIGVADGEVLDRDGRVEVRVRPEGVFLVVTAPMGNGRPAGLPLAERALARKEIVDIDWAAVQAALEAKTGQPVLVAPRHPDLDRDATVDVEVSPDGMEAYLVLQPALGGRKLSVDRIEQALRLAGVVEGVKREVIEGAVRTQDAGGRFLVAKGRPPLDGNDGYIDYRFPVKGVQPRPLELEDGRVDYYNLQTVQSATAGQVLAVRVAPTKGLAGVTVTGRPLPAKAGREVRLPKGKNTDVNPADPNELVAVITGQVVVAGGKVNVLPVYEVHGDVDFGTGNIDFQGSVVVKGSVRNGFAIRATGNVEVRGLVEGATILTEGDVIIRGGVQGGDRGRISGRNIQAKFIQNCRVEATGDVIVDEGLLYTEVDAQGKVEVRGSKGRIVGGTVRAVSAVSARVIGSKFGTRTEVMVGVSPEIRAELERVTRELAVRERQLDEVVKSIRVVKEAVAAGRPVPHGDGDRLSKLVEAMQQLSEIISELRPRQEELRVLVESASAGQVRAAEMVFPGVRVSIGSVVTLVRDETAKALFYLDEGEIRVGTA